MPSFSSSYRFGVRSPQILPVQEEPHQSRPLQIHVYGLHSRRRSGAWCIFRHQQTSGPGLPVATLFTINLGVVASYYSDDVNLRYRWVSVPYARSCWRRLCQRKSFTQSWFVFDFKYCIAANELKSTYGFVERFLFLDEGEKQSSVNRKFSWRMEGCLHNFVQIFTRQAEERKRVESLKYNILAFKIENFTFSLDRWRKEIYPHISIPLFIYYRLEALIQFLFDTLNDEILLCVCTLDGEEVLRKTKSTQERENSYR